MGNSGPLVQKLWRTEIACGKRRKTQVENGGIRLGCGASASPAELRWMGRIFTSDRQDRYITK
jgi:hypothetical protein